MFTTILGGLALLALVAAVVILIPSDPWPLDGEIWYEQFAPRSGRGAVAEELAIMRMDAEAETIAAVGQPGRSRPAVATAPASGNVAAPNRSW